jgi:hypothetical protein
VKNEISYQTISPLLNTGENRLTKFGSYAGLVVGMLLLFCCAQMYFNLQLLIKEKNLRKNGFDYISISKNITNQNMGADNRFTPSDIEALKKQPFISDVAPLISNQFRAKASAGNILPFSTDLFLESIDDAFIDTLPPGFKWQPGQVDVPIIFSSDYLEIYNVFAPAQELPQLSQATIQSVNIMLECYSPGGVQTFRGHIVGLTDRVNSILVPKSFLTWANKHYGNAENPLASRLYIKTTDANSAELLNFLQQKDYRVNKDKTKFGRVKQVLQGVLSGMAVFSVLVILLAMLLFSFYLQLMIARSKDHLQLLITLGYSPLWLGKTVSQKWIPVYAGIIIVALLLTQLFHLIFRQGIFNGTELLPPLIQGWVAILALLLFFICVITNYKMLKSIIGKL